MARLFAIGDVHGCSLALDALLGVLDLRRDDRLVFLGDYVDRGPDSRGVIERLIELEKQKRHVFLRGNHDEWMMKARTDTSWLRSWHEPGVGGEETEDSYRVRSLKEVPRAHFGFLERTRLYSESERHIFVHGATLPEPLAHTPEQWLLWRRVWDIEPHPSGKRVICGHTAQENGRPLDRGFAVCVDTFCHGGGWLSALEVASNEVIQANQHGQTRRGTLEELGERSR